MSGGHWNYENNSIGYFVDEHLERDRYLHDVLVPSLISLLSSLDLLLYELDLHFSGDTEIKDLDALEKFLQENMTMQISKERFKEELLKITRG